MVSSNVAGNPYFSISRNKVILGIDNAINIKKIPPQSQEQSEQLVKEIFSTFEIDELILISTKCPTCNTFYSVPKM